MKRILDYTGKVKLPTFMGGHGDLELTELGDRLGDQLFSHLTRDVGAHSRSGQLHIVVELEEATDGD